ncbi:hypothetical protein QTP88_008427 [Uroleucon formosanum]
MCSSSKKIEKTKRKYVLKPNRFTILRSEFPRLSEILRNHIKSSNVSSLCVPFYICMSRHYCRLKIIPFPFDVVLRQNITKSCFSFCAYDTCHIQLFSHAYDFQKRILMQKNVYNIWVKIRSYYQLSTHRGNKIFFVSRCYKLLSINFGTVLLLTRKDEIMLNNNMIVTLGSRFLRILSDYYLLRIINLFFRRKNVLSSNVTILCGNDLSAKFKNKIKNTYKISGPKYVITTFECCNNLNLQIKVKDEHTVSILYAIVVFYHFCQSFCVRPLYDAIHGILITVIITKMISIIIGHLFDSKLFFNAHVSAIKNKSLAVFGMIKKNCFDFLDPLALKCLYTSLVRSLLEYAPLIWDHNNVGHNDQLEKVQNKDLRFICYKRNIQRTLHSGYDNILKLLNLESLNVRRHLSFNKIDDSFLLSQLNFKVNNHYTRNNHLFYIPHSSKKYTSYNPIIILMSSGNSVRTFLGIESFTCLEIKVLCLITNRASSYYGTGNIVFFIPFFTLLNLDVIITYLILLKCMTYEKCELLNSEKLPDFSTGFTCSTFQLLMTSVLLIFCIYFPNTMILPQNCVHIISHHHTWAHYKNT